MIVVQFLEPARPDNLMFEPMVRSSFVLAAAISAVPVLYPVVYATGQASRRDADQMKQKVAAIERLGERPDRGEARRTTVTENEVNAYLALDGREELPPGVVDPVVSILGTGRVSGRATVDLDAVRKQKKPT